MRRLGKNRLLLFLIVAIFTASINLNLRIVNLAAGRSSATPTVQISATPFGGGTSELVFGRSVDNAPQAIFIIRFDKKNRRQISKPSDTGYQYPAWSPDGTKLAYVAIYYKTTLMISDGDGKNERALLEDPERIIFPVWSPDGKFIAFSIWDVTNEKARIGIINVTSNEVHFFKSQFRYMHSPSWSPDGKKLVFTAGSTRDAEIYLMTVDEKKLTRLTNNNVMDGEADWSPNGEEIVFFSARSPNFGIYIMDTNGRNIRFLVRTNSNNVFPRLSPDGTQIVYTNLEGNVGILYYGTLNSEHTQFTTTRVISGGYWADWQPSLK